jgi:ribosomal protein S18 acetylase RimI-like enzyme
LTREQLIRAIEEISLNALPALQTVHFDGWLVRMSRGYARRANSVNPLYPSTLPLDQKIRYCEEIYAAQDADVIFKLTPASEPSELDAVLAERGYQREATTSVQVADLASLTGEIDQALTIAERLEPSWIADYCRLQTVPDRLVKTLIELLGLIVPPTGFATFRRDGETLAVGLAVRERDDVGLFDIVTAMAARNQGIGRRLVSGLLDWGRAGGATRGYLQVMLTNQPALRLYESLGFREAYQYWYRTKAIR